MKKRKVSITVADPCHESWHTMSPRAHGRHCSSCEKTVVDFTQFTDKQVLDLLKAEKNICGRFHATQLNRHLKDSSQPHWVKKVAYAGGLLGLTACGDHDQTFIPLPLIEATIAMSVSSEASLTHDIPITGEVTIKDSIELSSTIADTPSTSLDANKTDASITSEKSGHQNKEIDKITSRKRIHTVHKLPSFIESNRSIKNEKKIESDIIVMGSVAVGIPITPNYSGIVTDENNHPLVAANVYIEGSKHGTITDVNGKFELEKKEGMNDRRLVISYIGYETKYHEIKDLDADNNTFVLNMNDDILLGIVCVTKEQGFIEKGLSKIKTLITQSYSEAIINQKSTENASSSEAESHIELSENNSNPESISPRASIFPNPAFDKVQLKIDRRESIDKIEIYNTQGQSIKSYNDVVIERKENFPMDVSYLLPGVYHISVTYKDHYIETIPLYIVR